MTRTKQAEPSASRWNGDKHYTDITTLTYPYTPVDNDGDAAEYTFATLQDAEDKLDWYKDHYEFGTMSPQVVRDMRASTKLYRAAAAWLRVQAAKERKQDKAVARVENHRAAMDRKAAYNEAYRATRAADKLAADLAEWVPAKLSERAVFVSSVRKALAKLEALPQDLDPETMLELGELAGGFGTIAGAMKNHVFSITSSRLGRANQQTKG